MANIIMFLSKLTWILISVILTVLIWKTAEYFNTLPKDNKHRDLLSWDILMLCCMLISYILRILTT